MEMLLKDHHRITPVCELDKVSISLQTSCSDYLSQCYIIVERLECVGLCSQRRIF